MAKSSLPASRVRLKRVYESADADDGTRILVDRLWPRGISKEKADVAEWLKELGPSTELRKWFGHDPARWPEFQRRYKEELQARGGELDRLRDLAGKGTVTLVYGAHDEEHNQAVVIRDVLLHGGRSSTEA